MAPMVLVLVAFGLLGLLALPIPLWVARALPRPVRPELPPRPAEPDRLGVDLSDALEEAYVVADAVGFALRQTEDVLRIYPIVVALGPNRFNTKDNWATELVQRQQRAESVARGLYGAWEVQLAGLPDVARQRLPAELDRVPTTALAVPEALEPAVGMPSRGVLHATITELSRAHARVVAFARAMAEDAPDPYR